MGTTISLGPFAPMTFINPEVACVDAMAEVKRRSEDSRPLPRTRGGRAREGRFRARPIPDRHSCRRGPILFFV